MRKWLILFLVALFSSSAIAGQPKLRGPSRSLNSRPRISSMKDRGKPHVRVHTNTRKRGSLRYRSRRNRQRHYRTPQPVIVIVQVLPTPIPKPEPRPIIVLASTHVTIFIESKSNSGSKRFTSAYGGGLIIFPEKSKAKTEP